MEIKEFIEKFADAIESENVTACTSETEFRNLDEWNSLAALSVIAMVDEEYNVTLKGDDVRKAKTIGDLYEIIKNKQ